MSEFENNVPQPNGGEVPGKGAAIGSLVCGIISLVLSSVGVTLIVAIIGLVLAAKAKNAGFNGGLRTAGFVLSLLGVIFSAVGLVSCIACGGLACLGAAAEGMY